MINCIFLSWILVTTYLVFLKSCQHLFQNSTPAPPIPEPDYSMSESDDEGDKPKGETPAVAETSANSNARYVVSNYLILKNSICKSL